MYQPGKANIVADALSRSRPSVAETEESAKRGHGADRDAAKPEDQQFDRDQLQTITSSVHLKDTELSAFRDAQQVDPVLKKLLELPTRELQRRQYALSPQGILVKVEDGEQRPVVPQAMRQKILQENHNIPTIGSTGDPEDSGPS